MSKKRNNENYTPKKGRSGMGFGKGIFMGFFLGIVLGIGLGWWFRPPSSFPIEDLKRATEDKVLTATDKAREQLANFAEDLAKKLREKSDKK